MKLNRMFLIRKIYLSRLFDIVYTGRIASIFSDGTGPTALGVATSRFTVHRTNLDLLSFTNSATTTFWKLTFFLDNKDTFVEH